MKKPESFRSGFGEVSQMSERTTIYALGFFDGVHRGHQVLMRECRKMADKLGCKAGAITFFTHPDVVIWRQNVSLINTTHDRAMLLKDVGKMDTVVMLPFNKVMMKVSYQDFFRMMVDKYNAAGFVCGADYHFGYIGQGNGQILQQLCAEEGIPCKVMTKLKSDGDDISSTRIRQLLKAGQTEKANELLGHPHMLTGQVISGNQLGRALGTPTANLILPEGLDCLRYGVYACKAYVEGVEHLAVTNVGTRPTVGGEGVTVEAWLLDFNADLYGEMIRLEFYKFLRPEQKFACIEDLKAEIQKNARQTRDFFEKK